MTEQEVAKVLYVLNVNYKSDKNTNALDMEKRVKLWAVEFKDEDVELVNLAVKIHIRQSEWYPSIASIKKIVEELKMELSVSSKNTGGRVIHIGNKLWYAKEVTEIEVTPEEEKYLDNLWNFVALED